MAGTATQNLICNPVMKQQTLTPCKSIRKNYARKAAKRLLACCSFQANRIENTVLLQEK
jgi:hypothetical protein